MVSKHTTLNVRGSKDGQPPELQVGISETDTPLLPVAHLERLHSFNPEAVDWVLAQTEKEAEHRRSESALHEKRVFIERIAGMVLAASLCLCSIIGSVAAALNGHSLLSIVLGGTTIMGLASAFLSGRRK